MENKDLKQILIDLMPEEGEDIIIRYLQNLSDKISSLEGKLDSKLETVDFSEVHERIKEVSESFNKKLSESESKIKSKIEGIHALVDENKKELTSHSREIKKTLDEDIRLTKREISDQAKISLEKIKIDRIEVEGIISEFVTKTKDSEADVRSLIKDLKKDLELKIAERLSALSLGGGSMNRQVLIGGTDYLTRYTDINWIAGNGVTITATNNDTRKRVDVTITGGIGSSTLTATGTIDDSNKAFTFISLPTVLVINGAVYQQTGGAITWTWTVGTLTATLSAPVGSGGSIFGLT